MTVDTVALGATFGGAVVAGLAGSPHCVGMCGGFAAACGRRVPEAAAWHAGRITTYAALGALAASVGGILPGPRWLPGAVAAVLLVWFAGVFAGVIPDWRPRIPGLSSAAGALMQRRGTGARYLLGLATGLLPCGLVYTALAVPVALGEPALGALAMASFGLGTVPILAALAAGAQRVVTAGLWPRRLLALVILAAGLWSIALRTARGPAGAPPAAHRHAP